jgi:hypothetical protein
MSCPSFSIPSSFLFFWFIFFAIVVSSAFLFSFYFPPAYAELGYCLLPVSPEPSVFPSLVKKSKGLKVRMYTTIILPVVLCGCETWSLTLREEHRLKVFKNRVLRRIFGAKRDEVTGG